MANLYSVLNGGQYMLSDMQVLFSTVFAFSVNLLQLVILEVLGALDYRSASTSYLMCTHLMCICTTCMRHLNCAAW